MVRTPLLRKRACSAADRPSQNTHVDRLEHDYYVDRPRVKDAIRERRSFHVIHLPTMMKVDIFVAERDPFAAQEQERARPESITEHDSRTFNLNRQRI